MNIDTAIASLITLITTMPDDDTYINDATIDAYATILIPLAQRDDFTLDHSRDLLNATDHLPLLCAELADTLRDNSELDPNDY